MRTSSLGKQARHESESPAQDVHVAEVDYGEPVSGESECPDKHGAACRRATWSQTQVTRPIKVTNGAVEATEELESMVPFSLSHLNVD